MARKMLGSVDLLGLGAFSGEGLNPIFGTLIGGGVAGASMLAARHVGGSEHAEIIGLGVGLAASGLMAAMPATRHAAVGSVIGAFFASGLAWLDKLVFSRNMADAITQQAAAIVQQGMGYPTARNLNGLGIANMRALNGLGIPTTSDVPIPAGAIPGVAGSHLAGLNGGGPPVSLMGRPTAASAHLLGIGGPPVHGLSAAYGATLLGANR